MSNYVPKKRHLWEGLLFFFNSKKNAAGSHKLFSETYVDYTSSIKTREYWFKRFENVDSDTEDKECPGHPPKIEYKKLETLLNKDQYQTQDRLAGSTIPRCLHVPGMIQKLGNWVLYDLRPRDVDFAAFQTTWKTNENLLWKSWTGSPTRPTVFCRYCSFYWVGNKVISFFFMIFKASLLIKITKINQLCIHHFVRWPFAIFQSVS